METRMICVLCPFTGADGTEHARGEILTVPYQTNKQHASVNSLITRGFATFDVNRVAEEQPPSPLRKTKGRDSTE